MKKHEFPKDSFIRGWYMPEEVCDGMVNYFNRNRHLARSGTTLENGMETVSNNNKESIDLNVQYDNFEKGVAAYRVLLQQALDLYVKEYPEINWLPRFDIENFNIQWYPKNGGFKRWHYERGEQANFYRVLVFMTYLNDVENGGTHFKYQNLTTPAKKGLTIIWPPDWTHTHKGQIVNKEKIIATGWYRLI